MNKSFLAVAALTLCSVTGSAGAGNPLSTRAVSALGIAIASQGNAALIQIRRELQDSALKTIEPFLPWAGKDTDETTDKSTAESKVADESTNADPPAETPLALRWL